MSAKPPIFIIGNPRSGTSLLRLMLTCHSNIAIPPESGFAIWWKSKYFGYEPKDWSSKKLLSACFDDILSSKKIEFLNLDKLGLIKFCESAPVANYAELIDRIYTYHAQSIGKLNARWGDKNNFYLAHIPDIQELFPNAQFIHIIRDPRDVVSSYLSLRNVSGKYAPQLPGTITQALEEWCRNIRIIQNALARIPGNQVVEIRFENLVMHPESTLLKICEFLDEPFDPNMLAYPELNKELGLEPADFLEWKAKTLQAPNKAAIGKFRTVLSNEETQEINECARDLLISYGYTSH
jgi:hypothetical protein